jgi:hypothetical protein
MCARNDEADRRLYLAFALLVFLLIQSRLYSSAQTASVVEGAVVDPQGKAIMGAVVSLTWSGLAGETQFWSDAV